MGFFKHFIFKIFLCSSVGGPLFYEEDYFGKVNSYTWVQDSNHQWILKAEFEKADLDTYYDKDPSSEGLGVSLENRPTKQVFVYYPAGRSYSGQTYVSYDCQFEQPACDVRSSIDSRFKLATKVKRWRFFYKDMSIPKMEALAYFNEIDPHFLYTGYAETFIEENLWYNKETLEDSFIFISYGLSEAAPKNSFWGRFKYQISKFFKFSETDYEIALKEEAKKEKINLLEVIKKQKFIEQEEAKTKKQRPAETDYFIPD